MPARHPFSKSPLVVAVVTVFFAGLSLGSPVSFVAEHVFSMDLYRPTLVAVAAWAAKPPLRALLFAFPWSFPLGTAGAGLVLADPSAPFHAAGMAAVSTLFLIKAASRTAMQPSSGLLLTIFCLITLGGTWVAMTAPLGCPWSWDPIETCSFLALSALLVCSHLWGKVAPTNAPFAALAALRFFRSGQALSAHHLQTPSQSTFLCWAISPSDFPRTPSMNIAVFGLFGLASRGWGLNRARPTHCWKAQPLLVLLALSTVALMNPYTFGGILLAAVYRMGWTTSLLAFHALTAWAAWWVWYPGYPLDPLILFTGSGIAASTVLEPRAYRRTPFYFASSLVSCLFPICRDGRPRVIISPRL